MSPNESSWRSGLGGVRLPRPWHCDRALFWRVQTAPRTKPSRRNWRLQNKPYASGVDVFCNSGSMDSLMRRDRAPRARSMMPVSMLDRQNAGDAADERDALEHAHHGKGGKAVADGGEPDLARIRSATSSSGNFQAFHRPAVHSCAPSRLLFPRIWPFTS